MRKAFAALGAALMIGVFAAPAFAHVTIQPSEAPAGAFYRFAIRVPNERDVPNSKIAVTFPENLISVSFQPKAGWDRKVTMKTLDEPIEAFGASIDEVVDTVTWSGGSIEPGEFEEFYFSARVPEEEGALEFSADQFYDGGEVVTWSGPEDSDNPSPRAEIVTLPEGGQLTLLAEALDEIEDLKGDLAESDRHMGEMMAEDEGGEVSNAGVVLGAIGIVLGTGALVVALMRGRGSGS